MLTLVDTPVPRAYLLQDLTPECELTLAVIWAKPEVQLIGYGDELSFTALEMVPGLVEITAEKLGRTLRRSPYTDEIPTAVGIVYPITPEPHGRPRNELLGALIAQVEDTEE